MTWLPASALAGLPGMPGTVQHVHRIAQTMGWASRTGQATGHRPAREFLVDDLPDVTRQALATHATAAVRPLAQAVNAGVQSRRDAQVQAHAQSMAALGMTLQAQGSFDPARNPRLDIFQRFESYHRTRGGAIWPAIGEFCTLWAAGCIDCHPGTRAAHPELKPKTLDKWYRTWTTQGVAALLERQPRKDKGQTALSRDAELYAAFIAAMAELHDPTARQVERVLCQHLGAERMPSASTLKRWLSDFKRQHQVPLLRFKNPDGWRNKYMVAFGSRSEHITAPNVEWQLDSTIADGQQETRAEIAFNLHDAATGEIRRHALVAGIEVFTRRAKVLVSRTSSGNAVKAVVRRAMLDWGMPERIKTDNGRDYTAVDFDFALSALKVEHLLCTPFRPDQKPFIERFLGTLLHDLFPMLAGYVGHDVATRKAIESAKSFAQRFGEDGLRVRLTPEQLQGVIDGWLDEYHARTHSELGCSPNDMAERHTASVVRVDARALDLFLMPVAGSGMRTVGKRGISMPLSDRPGSGWYAAPELAAANVMGTEVYCRIEEADVGAMHVFALDGTYICRALDHARLGINRAELAAKARAIETETVKPMVDALRKATRKGITRKAVDALYLERTAAAADAAVNVHRLLPRTVAHTTPAIASVLARQPNAQRDQEERQAARAALAEADERPTATVQQLTTPRQRYSAWVRLQARMQAHEQISEADQTWARSYAGSSEWEAWHAMQAGADPLQGAG